MPPLIPPRSRRTTSVVSLELAGAVGSAPLVRAAARRGRRGPSRSRRRARSGRRWPGPRSSRRSIELAHEEDLAGEVGVVGAGLGAGLDQRQAVARGRGRPSSRRPGSSAASSRQGRGVAAVGDEQRPVRARAPAGRARTSSRRSLSGRPGRCAGAGRRVLGEVGRPVSRPTNPVAPKTTRSCSRALTRAAGGRRAPARTQPPGRAACRRRTACRRAPRGRAACSQPDRSGPVGHDAGGVDVAVDHVVVPLDLRRSRRCRRTRGSGTGRGRRPTAPASR